MADIGKNYYNKKIRESRVRRRRQMFCNTVFIVVVVVFVFALCRGNLRKGVISQASTKLEVEAASDAKALSQENMVATRTLGYTQHTETDSSDISERSGDIYDSGRYIPANVTDDRYFDTALIVGDSRAEALWLHSDVEGWDLCSSKELDIENVATSKLMKCRTGYDTVYQKLCEKTYDNIYVSFGIEELSWYNEKFVSCYRSFLDRISELSPSSNIYIMSILPVSAELSSKDSVYNNPGIDKLNSLLMELAEAYDNVIYLDVADGVCENGVLPENVGIDGIHYNKAFCKNIMGYIKQNIYTRK